MAIHVLNKVQFSGSTDKVKEVMNFIKSNNSDFDFEKILPIPENLKNLHFTDDNFGKNWEWQKRNWGTGQPYIYKKTTSNIFYFDTDYAPPSLLLNKIASLFPEVEILHVWATNDRGSAGCGQIIYKGVQLKQKQIKDHKQSNYFIYRDLDKELNSLIRS